MPSSRSSYCLSSVLLEYSLAQLDWIWWAHSAAVRRKFVAWSPPTFDRVGEVVAVNVGGVLLAQVLELNEQACTHGEVVTSVARDDILANLTQLIHSECFRAAPSAKVSRVCAKKVNPRHTTRVRKKGCSCVVECVNGD